MDTSFGYLRLAYDDADTASAMGRDCRLVADRLLAVRPAASTQPAQPIQRAPSTRATRHDKVKREITVDEAARRLAGALHLHLD